MNKNLAFILKFRNATIAAMSELIPAEMAEKLWKPEAEIIECFNQHFIKKKPAYRVGQRVVPHAKTVAGT